MDKVVEIMIDSASRPNLLKQTLPTVIEHMKFDDGKIRWMFHEAVLSGLGKKSNENLEYIEELGIFDIIKQSDPPVGEGNSIKSIINETESKYFIHWEDDFIATRTIDLDEMYDIMETTDINQLVLNRRKTMAKVAGWIKGEYEINGKMFTTSPHWRYTPAIWRLSFIKPIVMRLNMDGSNSHWTLNRELQNVNKDDKTHEWVHKKLKTYYYGPIKEEGFCNHIGYGHSNRGTL